MKAFLFNIFLILTLALAQNTSVLNIGNVKPNLVLAAVSAFLVFSDNFGKYFILLLSGIIGLQFTAGLNYESLWLFLFLLAAFLIKKYLLRKRLMDVLFLIIFLTAVFYLIVEPGFIIHNPEIFISEIVYNGIVGAMFYFILKTFWYESHT